MSQSGKLKRKSECLDRRMFRIDQRIFWGLVIMEMEKDLDSQINLRTVCDEFFQHKKTSQFVTRQTLLKEYEDLMSTLRKTTTKSNSLIESIKEWYSEKGFNVREEEKPKVSSVPVASTSSSVKTKEKVSCSGGWKKPNKEYLTHPGGRDYPPEPYKFYFILDLEKQGLELYFTLKEFVLDKGGRELAQNKLDRPENRDVIVIRVGPYNEAVEKFLKTFSFHIYCPCLLTAAMEYEFFDLDERYMLVDHYDWFQEKDAFAPKHSCSHVQGPAMEEQKNNVYCQTDGRVQEPAMEKEKGNASCQTDEVEKAVCNCQSQGESEIALSEVRAFDSSLNREKVDADSQTDAVEDQTMVDKEVQTESDEIEIELPAALMSLATDYISKKRVWFLLKMEAVFKEHATEEEPTKWIRPHTIEKAVFSKLTDVEKKLLNNKKPSNLTYEINCFFKKKTFTKDMKQTLRSSLDDNFAEYFEKEYMGGDFKWTE